MDKVGNTRMNTQYEANDPNWRKKIEFIIWVYSKLRSDFITVSSRFDSSQNLEVKQRLSTQYLVERAVYSQVSQE